jgi:hypothetical protein
MKKLLTIVFLCVAFISNAQFLKFSTLYISGNVNSPLSEQPRYMMDRTTGKLTDITVINPYNYKINLGIRKIARFDYENKSKVFYDGSESSVSGYAPIGAVSGFEYLGNLSMVRDRGNEFINQDYWIRYVRNFWLVKGEYVDNQNIKLKHFGGEARARIKLGGFDFTAGIKHRTHPVYGYMPFEENFNLEEDSWWSVAYDLGYTDEYWFYDGEQNGTDDYYDYFNWNWYAPDGTQVAHTDEEFMKYHFGRAIDEYNQKELKAMGPQQELSAVIGIAYYTYNSNFWLHGWVDILPYHKGLSDYSYTSMEIEDKKELDFDIGIIIGTKLTKKLGLFLEGHYQRYWDIKNYEVKTGINYLIL